MSGVNRNIKAEVASKGLTGEAALAAFTPDKIRAEKGRTIHSPSGKNADDGEYIGKNAKPAS